MDMATLAAHHHRVFSSTSSASPRTHRRSSSLTFPSSSSSLPHGRPRGARVLRHAAGGGSAVPAASSSSLEELSRSCTTWTWRGMRVNYLVRGEGIPVAARRRRNDRSPQATGAAGLGGNRLVPALLTFFRGRVSLRGPAANWSA